MTRTPFLKPIEPVVLAVCTAVLGVGITPWFWLLTAIFLTIWVVGVVNWIWE